MSGGISERIKDIIPESRILRDEPMKKHTTFKVGGPAAVFVMPESPEELAGLISFLHENEEKYLVIGNGSNLLVSDNGYDGVCIQIMSGFDGIRTEGTAVKAGAGALLSKIADTALQNGLSGFEFASGIPGTAGGAMVMNAGAYGGEMKDIVSFVEVITREGKQLKLSCDEMDFSYRNSAVRKEGYIVTGVEFILKEGNKEEIKSLMSSLAEKRREKQPLEFPSAGSTFKRPEGHFAGKLIMDAGLSGYSVGDARVSEKHCGFIVNTGNATAGDIYELICHVQDEVFEKYEVKLEPEVCMIGEF